jgi:hypothetical protein
MMEHPFARVEQLAESWDRLLVLGKPEYSLFEMTRR